MEIKEVVKQKYGQAALRVATGGSTCCGSMARSNGDSDPVTSNLYEAGETTELPEERPQALVIPIEAVPAGQTSSVYVVTEPGQIQERQVSFGINTPTKFEVTAGLKEGELVFVGRRSQVHPGEKVQPTLIDPLAQR